MLGAETLMVRQTRGYHCSYDFDGDEWDDEELRVHNPDYPLEVRTISTVFHEPPMYDIITFEVSCHIRVLATITFWV